MRREMRNAPGFSWLHQHAAAQFCLQNKANLEEALGWARQAANPQVGGQENFTTLLTVAQLLEATGKASGGAATGIGRSTIPRPTPSTLHQFGRGLLNQKRPAEAMKVFEANARHLTEPGRRRWA